MKHWFLFLLFISVATAQTKQQLIDSIIKFNEFHSDCVYATCSESEQYKNSRKLIAMLTPRELLKLTNHDNGVLRMFAVRECIETGRGDVASFFKKEFERNQMVYEQDGCTGGLEFTTNIVYHDYLHKIGQEEWHKHMGEVNELSSEQQRVIEKAVDDRVASDEKMLELDSIVISKDNASWLLYSRAFENRKFPEEYLPQIEKLAFKYNNSSAQQHLITHYPAQYKERIKAYWYSDFPKAKFKTYDDRFYFTNIVEMMLASGDEALKLIIAAKLKKYKDWQYAGTSFQDLLKEKGIHFKEHR